MDNKFPGKDISDEDLKTKFPLASSLNKRKIIKITDDISFEEDTCPVIAGPNTVENKDMIMEAEKALDAVGSPSSLSLWCMMETPLGILHAEEVAFSSPRDLKTSSAPASMRSCRSLRSSAWRFEMDISKLIFYYSTQWSKINILVIIKCKNFPIKRIFFL